MFLFSSRSTSAPLSFTTSRCSWQKFTGAKIFKALTSKAYIALHLFPLARPAVGTSFCRFPSIALRYWQYLRSMQELFSLKFFKEIQMVKWMMPAAAAFLLAACSMGGHDTSDTSGSSAGATSSSSTPSSYPTGASSGASDVGSSSSTSGSSAIGSSDSTSGSSSSDSATGTSAYPGSAGTSSYPSTSGSTSSDTSGSSTPSESNSSSGASSSSR